MLGVLACALFSSCAHVYEDDGFAADAGSVRDQDTQTEEGGEGSTDGMSPHQQPSGDEGAHERDAGRPSGEDAAVAFDPVTVQSEVSSEHATPNDDIAILWRTFHPSHPYFAQRMTIEGDLDFFRVVLPDEPPVEGRYQPQDAESGLEPPDAPWIAAGSIYRVVAGKIDSSPDGVEAFDTDVVIGQTRGVVVWTPVELAPGWHLETKGIARSSDEPLAPGWHLFVDYEEVDMGTLLTLSNEIHD